MKLSKQHQLSFAQQLLNLLNAGLALLNAIELIRSSTPKARQA
jgi:type IV pilus assembly protein PilC